HASSLTVMDGIETAVLVPASTLPTTHARSLLPAEVPHTHAAFNVGRAALLVNALAGRPEDLMAATEDKLHQHYRADVMAPAMAMMRHLREQGLAAVVSGAGPSVLVLGMDLAQSYLASGPLPWAEGVGGETWYSVHTTERVPGATALRVQA